MEERPYQIYETHKGWTVLDCTLPIGNQILVERLTKGVANHYAEMLNKAYYKGAQAKTIGQLC